MATYTAAQLYGAGVVGENLSGLKTFTFTNSDASTAYFTLETVRNANGIYDNNAPANAVGSWVVSASMQPGFVTSSQVASLVIPPGVSVVTFTPTSAVTGTTYYLRGAGNFSLVIS